MVQVVNEVLDANRTSGKLVDNSLKSETAQKLFQEWIEATTGVKFPHSNFVVSLRDGVLLCKLVHRIQPRLAYDVIELPSNSEIEDNFNTFLNGCKELGLSNWQLFTVEDLQECENSNQRLSVSEDAIAEKFGKALYWLGVTSGGMSYYKGPKLDVTQFERTNGNVTVKQQNGSLSHNGVSMKSAVQYNGSDQEISLTNGVNTLDTPTHLMNGYKDNSVNVDTGAQVFAINVRMFAHERRFGFSVMGGSDEGFPPRIDDITEGSPASRDNLRINDEILEVNGVSVVNDSHVEVIEKIHKCIKNTVIALKIRRGGEFLPNETEGEVDSATRNKLQTIIKNQENDPDFQHWQSDSESMNSNENNNESYQNGTRTYVNLAMDSPSESPQPWKSGQPLWDQKNKTALASNLAKNKSLSMALTDLRHLDDDDDDDNDNPTTDEETNVIIDQPWAPQNPAYESDTEVDVVPFVLMQESLAEKEPFISCAAKLRPRLQTSQDQREIDFVQEHFENKDVQNATMIYKKVKELEKSNRGPNSLRPSSCDSRHLTMQVYEEIGPGAASHDAQELKHILNSPNFQGLLLAHDRVASSVALPDEDDDELESSRLQPFSSNLSLGGASDDQTSQNEDDTVKIVRIDKANDPLGATVKNEDGNVVIGRIVKGGAAEKSGLLHEGDEILEINGVNVKGKSVAEVCELLADMDGTLTFLLYPSNKSTTRTLPRDREVHVKALYDYDPSEDELIPCRELGLPFRRGDILHVVNQDDESWWQAWRAGEEGMKLAGLVPSRHFQQQRESMKHTIPTNAQPSKKDSRCLCFKRKRRKKVLYNAQRNEDFVVDEVLSYEEVAFLRPNPSRKRPIVLIGPTKIGRKELRQRLIQYSPDRFVGAVPHTSRPKRPDEVNSREYFFVPRPAFEADIVAHKFVEHGELQGHYYGTSLDAIKRIVHSGKVCILNLHCEALKTLKASDLKPYVIFVSPPSYERIKALRRGKVDPFNPQKETMNDSELEQMVNKSRELEHTYGHYFDYTIINTDFERTFDELRQVIDRLESEGQWVPASWVR